MPWLTVREPALTRLNIWTADFHRGDVNQDGQVDLADVIFLLEHLFSSGSDPSCSAAADLNDDELLDVADAIYGLNYLFSRGPVLPEPSACAQDPTGGPMTCPLYAACP